MVLLDNLPRNQLDALEIVLSSSDMQILKALFNAQSSIHKYLTCDELNAYISDKDEKEVTKTWIYQCLNSLENRGFIHVDILANPRKYMASAETVSVGLDKALRKRMREIDYELETLEQSITELKSLDSTLVTSRFKNILTGRSEIKEYTIIVTSDDFRKAITTQLLANTKKGDVLHIIDRPALLRDSIGQSGIAEKMIVEFVNKGGILKTLLLVKDIQSELEMLLNFLGNIRDSFLEGLASNRMEIKILNHRANTYRFLSLNNEKMILILTDSICPDKAILFDREDNSILFDDALKNFNELFEKGKNISEMMMKMDQEPSLP